MATITSNTYLDDGTARTAGETWTFNGGKLTIRTDTRVHANAPASMTGSIGATTGSATLGGGLIIDSSNVRWLAYDTGSGNVPAIGTDITQGGVTSSYLLGVYASLTSAPTAVGAAMPASGFIKFREVDGAFSAGALTGIGANATGADVVGWIEVVQRQAVANTVARLNEFTVNPDNTTYWFELGTTSGSANQDVQIPTNGGGSGTHVPGIWIETGVGTDEYEFYPALVASIMSTTNLGTDARSKFVCTAGNGVAKIGHNGTTTVGYVPVAGCKIRVPNVFLRQSTSAGGDANNQAPNATLATRPDFTTTSAGVININGALSDWYHLYAQPFSARHHDFATFDTFNISECASPLDLVNGGTGMYSSLDVNSLLLTSNFFGGNITDWYGQRGNAPGSNDHDISINFCIGQTLTRVHGGIVGFARSTGYSIYANQSQNLIFDDCYVKNMGIYLNTCKNVSIDGIDYCDRYVGSTNTTGTNYAVTIQNSSDTVTVRDVTFGLKGTVANVHPYGGIFTFAASSNLKLRECGSRSTVLSGGSSNNPAYIFNDGGNNSNVQISRVYMQPTRTAPSVTLNSTTGLIVENVLGDFADTVTTASLNTKVRGGSGTNTTTGQSSVYGTHFADGFTSDTLGRLWLALNEPTTTTDDFVTIVSGNPAFTSAGGLSMPTLGDQIIIEMEYFALGHTAFRNVAPTLTGTNTGNHTIEYQIDVNDGNGYNGTWNTLNATNLSAETIDPANGFKLKYRITTATASTTNLLSYIRIDTDSTLVAQSGNLYPLTVANATFSFSGLEVGTEVVLFDNGGTEIVREAIAGTTFEYDYEWNSNDGDETGWYALIWKDDKYPILYDNIELTDTSVNVPISQADDLVYNASYTPNSVVDFANSLIIMDSGALEFNVPEVYSYWKDELLSGNNASYAFAYSIVGGNPVGGSNTIPYYTFLSNGWKVRPDEADHTLDVTNGILVTDDNSDPFVDTLGAYTVRINYQQPVNAIAVATGGGGGATPADIWTYATRTLTGIGSSGIASESNATTNVGSIITILNALNDIAPSDVLTQVANALATYDAPTKAELDTAEANIIASSGGASVSDILNADIDGKTLRNRVKDSDDQSFLASVKP